MIDGIGDSSRITVKSVVILVIICLIYLLLAAKLLGSNSSQVVLVSIFCVMYFLSAITRKFILGFAIFIVFWIIFDFMKAFPNYHYNIVHIADLYHLEKYLFGINVNGKLLTPNEYWRNTTTPFIIVLTGIFYLCWIPVPIGFAVFLFFFRSRKQFLCFLLTFFLVNMIGFVIYYLFPAAPPWYVQYHGFDFVAKTPGNTAGLSKFDNYFHVGIFKSLYAKSSNVFAAMPSLHSSYPVIVLYYSLKNRLGYFNIVFVTVMLGIWFTAVYASHHYVLDVLAGITCAITAIVLFNTLMNKVNFFRTFVDRYEKLIS